MGIFDVILGRVVVRAMLVGSIVPVVLLGAASDRLVEMGLPRDVTGSIAAVLMIAWAVAVLAFLAKQIDWD